MKYKFKYHGSWITRDGKTFNHRSEELVVRDNRSPYKRRGELSLAVKSKKLRIKNSSVSV